MRTEPTRKEVRQARAFLRKRHVETRRIAPEEFARLARDMRVTFGDLFDRIAAKAETASGARA